MTEMEYLNQLKKEHRLEKIKAFPCKLLPPEASIERSDIAQCVDQMIDALGEFSGISTMLSPLPPLNADELTKFNQYMTEEELPRLEKLQWLLEKLQKMPVPLLRELVHIRNSLVRGVYAKQAEWGFDCKFGWGTVAASEWREASDFFLKDVAKNILSLAKRYHLDDYFGDEKVEETELK